MSIKQPGHDSNDGSRVGRAVDALLELFQARPAGLLADVDGTISRITRQPMAATVSPEARRALAELAARLDVVSVITGRAVSRARLMVATPEIGYVGNHGLEWWENDQVVTHPAAALARRDFDAALRAVRATVSRPGVIVEDKGVSVAIHYRLADRPDEAGSEIIAALLPYVDAGAVRLIEGALVANLLPPTPVDKGAAIVRLVDAHLLRSVAFFGDDVTDLDAFRALRALRDQGRALTLSAGVLSPEGPAQIRDEADLVLDGVGEVEQVLAALASTLPPASGRF